MPHVIVKLWPGKPERHKARLAGLITKSVMDALNYGEEAVSLVTGAASGLGFATAKAFVELDASVALRDQLVDCVHRAQDE